MPNQPISELFLRIAERCGRAHGIPLPKKLLDIGDPEVGWRCRFNNTDDPIDGIEPIHAFVYRNGWPVGVLHPFGGTLIRCEDDQEAKLIEWLQADLVTAE